MYYIIIMYLDQPSLTLPNVVSILNHSSVMNWRKVVRHLGVPKGETGNIEQAISWWMYSSEQASWSDLVDALCEEGCVAAASSDLKSSYGLLCGRLDWILCKRSGCTWSGELSDYLIHRKECAYRPVECPNRRKGCKALLCFEDLEDHQEECEYRRVPCPNASRGCSKWLLAKEVEQHLTRHCSLLKEESVGGFTTEAEFCDNIEKHVKRFGSINRYLAHLVFVGLPGSGKSTLIARLLKLAEVEQMLKACASTGVMNGIITVDVAEDAASFYPADIVSESTENIISAEAADVNECEWERVEYGLSVLRQMGVGGFVHEDLKRPGDASQDATVNVLLRDSVCSPECHFEVSVDQEQHAIDEEIHHESDGGSTYQGEHVSDVHQKDQSAVSSKGNPVQSSKKSKKKASAGLKRSKKAAADVKTKQQRVPGRVSLEMIQSLLREKGFSAIRPYLDNKCSLYLSDTGGQIEFQELLPLLVAGRAIFFFLFPLNLDLSKPVRVSYRKKVTTGKVKHSNVYTSSLTIKESFLQTLASIDSMEGFVDPSITKHKPYVFVVGTHKDRFVKKHGKNAIKKMAGIDGEFKALIKEHKYEGLVVYADSGANQLIFPVDNTCENDVFNKIRGRVVQLIFSSDEFRVQFPLSYLLASLDLQHSYEPFILRKDFAKKVLKYGIEKEDVDHLLKFLHSRIGQIRYFPVKEIRDIITREPQALFNLVTYLIIQSFLQISDHAKHTEIHKGIYTFDSFKIDEFLLYSSYLTPEQVIQLLKELRIVAPFLDQKTGIEKYFVPCVLNHLMECPREGKKSIVQPLAITFDCGHCPKGMFGVLLHHIVTRKSRKLEWNLDISNIFRDQVSFDVGPYGDVIVLKFCTMHLEVSCYPVKVAKRSDASTVVKICNTVRSMLSYEIEQATDSLRYNREKTKHSFGLVCRRCSMNHKVLEEGAHHMVKKCSKEGYLPLPDPGSFWFGSIPTYTFPEIVEKNDVLSLKEGCSHQMPFSVTCSPPLDSSDRHFLSKEDGSINETRVYIEGSAVHFHRVKRIDAGRYAVSSTNAAGQGQRTFHLRVKFPPTYSLDTKYLQVPAGTSQATVNFTVTSYPPLIEVGHTLSKKGGAAVTKRFTVEGNRIIFQNVNVWDSGMYTISCCNDDGEEGEETLELEVLPSTPVKGPSHSRTSTSQQQPKTVVRDNDIPFLIGMLYKYAYKWVEIGEALNFVDGEIQIIRHDFSRAHQCLATLLNQWSHWPTTDHPEEPTMERLRDALCSGWVGLGTEASEIYDMKNDLPSQQQRN